jgi:hypothetical protein
VVLDCAGHLEMESIIETKAATILHWIHGLRGSLHVTLEEGTCAAWLHDLRHTACTRMLEAATPSLEENFGSPSLTPIELSVSPPMPKENTCFWQLGPSLLNSEIFIRLTEARKEDT